MAAHVFELFEVYCQIFSQTKEVENTGNHTKKLDMACRLGMSNNNLCWVYSVSCVICTCRLYALQNSFVCCNTTLDGHGSYVCRSLWYVCSTYMFTCRCIPVCIAHHWAAVCEIFTRKFIWIHTTGMYPSIDSIDKHTHTHNVGVFSLSVFGLAIVRLSHTPQYKYIYRLSVTYMKCILYVYIYVHIHTYIYTYVQHIYIYIYMYM